MLSRLFREIERAPERGRERRAREEPLYMLMLAFTGGVALRYAATGEGKMTYNDGRVIDGIWSNNEPQ